MSRFTSTRPSAAPVGATSDVFTRNAIACAGTGGLLGIGAGSVLLTAAIMPAQVTAAVAACGGAVYAGNRIADGKSLNPFAKKEQPASEETVSVEASA